MTIGSRTSSAGAALGLALAALGAGCNREAGGEDGSRVLATGEGVQVTVDDFRARLREQSPSPGNSSATLDRKRELLDQLIELQVLVAEAKRQGLDRDPEIVSAMRVMMVQRLLRDRQSKSPAGTIPTEAELRARYEAEKARHATPELVRVNHLFLQSSPAAADRAQRLGEARELHHLALAMPTGDQGDPMFVELVRKRSDEAGTALTGGDLTFRAHSWLETQYSKAVADAAFALGPEQRLSEVVESDRGFHLLRFVARTPAGVPSFDQLRPLLVGQQTRQSRDEELRAYGRRLRESAKVVVRENELKALDAEAR